MRIFTYKIKTAIIHQISNATGLNLSTPRLFTLSKAETHELRIIRIIAAIPIKKAPKAVVDYLSPEAMKLVLEQPDKP